MAKRLRKEVVGLLGGEEEQEALGGAERMALREAVGGGWRHA